MSPIGESWEMFWPETGQWRPAKIINEAGERVELQFQDAPALPDLAKTISTTRQAMNNKAAFRRKP
jgi:hypothetical protein